MGDTFKCPACGHAIEMAQLSFQVRDEIRKEFEAEARKREKLLQDRELALTNAEKNLADSQRELEDEAERRAKAKLPQLEAQIEEKVRKDLETANAAQLFDLQQQIAAKDTKLSESRKAELSLITDRRTFEEGKAAFELEKARQIEAERDQIRVDAARHATESAEIELARLRFELDSKEQKLRDAQAAELEVIKTRQQLQDAKESFELSRNAESFTQLFSAARRRGRT